MSQTKYKIKQQSEQKTSLWVKAAGVVFQLIWVTENSAYWRISLSWKVSLKGGNFGSVLENIGKAHLFAQLYAAGS